MQGHLRTKIGILFACCALIYSCSINKVVPDGKALLVKNKIEAEKGKVTTTELAQQIKHEPNRRSLFLRYRFRRYLKTKDLEEKEQKGIPPVYLDTTRANLSAQNIRNYLFNAGYYDAGVDYSVQLKGKNSKKAVVTYHVKQGEPYKISEIHFKSAQADILAHIKNGIDTNRIHTGATINHDDLSNQRNRITTYLRNEGYYAFNRSYIDFQIDTNQAAKTVVLQVNVNFPEKGYHQIYTLGKVRVKILHSHETAGNVQTYTDRIEYEIGEYRLNPGVLSKNIRIRPYQEYKQSLVDRTYSRLINLGLFRLVNIRFVPEHDSSTVLTAIIHCEPNPKYDIIWEPQILNSDQRVSEQTSSSNYGVANVLTFKNRNIFYNGEEFDLQSRTSFETQLSQDSVKVVSTFAQQLNAELRFPRLLILDNFNQIPRSNKSQTKMNLSFLYERNQFYTRRVLPLNMTYEFLYDEKALYWQAGLISLNQSRVAPGFLSTVDERFINYYNQLFTNNLITSTRLMVVYTTKSKVYTPNGFKPGSYWDFYSNPLELAGIILPVLTKGGDVFNVQHSSFVRTDIDVRFNRIYNRHTSWVLRGYAGVGVPFRNTILPYERRYYVGGANSLRGWRPRTVGPGSYTNTSSLQIDRSGEILLTANAEYRFDVYSGPFDLEVALFMDAGNVWTFNNSTYPGGKFGFSTFIDEMALNTGLGLRFDFTYFLFRLDYGIPVKNPNLSPGDRWVIRNIIEKKGNFGINIWNIAINYPF